MGLVKHTLLFLALSGLLLAADKAPADDQAVRAAVEQFNDAARKGDEATLNKLLSADLIYGHSNAKIENKAECVAALVKSKPDFRMAPGMHVNIYGNTAVVHGKMGNLTGNPPTMQLDVLQVWVKSGAGWHMVARHTARINP